MWNKLTSNFKLTGLTVLSSVAQWARAGVGQTGVIIQDAGSTVLALVVVTGIHRHVAVDTHEAGRTLAEVAIAGSLVGHTGSTVLAEVGVTGVELGLTVGAGEALGTDALVLGQAVDYAGTTIEARVGCAWSICGG